MDFVKETNYSSHTVKLGIAVSTKNLKYSEQLLKKKRLKLTPILSKTELKNATNTD